MSLPKLKLRQRTEWVIDIEYPFEQDGKLCTKEAAWVFDTKEEAEAKIERLVKIKIAQVYESASPTE